MKASGYGILSLLVMDVFIKLGHEYAIPQLDPGLSAPNDSISKQQDMDKGTKNYSIYHIFAGTNQHVHVEQTKYASEGLETVLTKPTTWKGASHIEQHIKKEFNTYPDLSNSADATKDIKLEESSKLVQNVEAGFMDLDSPEDEPIIVVDESEEEEEADKTEDVHATSQTETKDTPLEKNKVEAEVALLSDQPLFPNVAQLIELLVKSFSPELSKILSTHDFSRSLPTKLKELPSKFTELTEELKELKNHVHELEIKLPGDLKDIPNKLETFTSTVKSLTTQVAKLKTLYPPISSSQTKGEPIKKDNGKKDMFSKVDEEEGSESNSDDTIHLTGSMVESSKKEIKELNTTYQTFYLEQRIEFYRLNNVSVLQNNTAYFVNSIQRTGLQKIHTAYSNQLDTAYFSTDTETVDREITMAEPNDYISITRKNFVSSDNEGRMVEKSIVEIQGTFLVKVRDNAFNGITGEDAYKHIDKFLEVVGPIKIKGLTHDRFRLSVYPISLTGPQVNNINGFCNGGELPGMVRVGCMTYFRDQKWYDELADGKLKEETLAHKAKVKGSWGDTTLGVMKFCAWLKISFENFHELNYDVGKTGRMLVEELYVGDTQENQGHDEHKDNPTPEPSICKIRRFKMMKYSFNDDEEYIAIKEFEYLNHSKDSLDAYRELLRLINKGWVVATPNEKIQKEKVKLND
ncbi:hypothetical protein Tco_1541324 [Tanacetum coccineum]